MNINSTQLNKERLNGNKLFLHSFSNFSTTSSGVSLRMHIIHSLFFILSLLTVIYIILVISIIFNIINKKESLAKINDLNFQVAQVEKKYNESVSGLTKDFAFGAGFVEAKDNHFVSRKDAAASLSFLYEKIQKK
ncbi:MAG: hypothetical protein RI945_287 [Candidatus Parcubacteria bacterium]